MFPALYVMGAISYILLIIFCVFNHVFRLAREIFLSPKPMSAPGAYNLYINSHVHDSILQWAPAVSKKCRESDTCVHFLPWLTDGASWEAARATWLQKASRLCAEIKYTDRLQITNSTCVCAAPNVHVACAWWSCWCWTSAVTSDPHLFPIPIPSGVKSGLGSPMGPSSRAATWGIKCSCIVELLYLADFLRHWCSRLLHWSSQKAACVVFYALKRPRAPRVCGFCFSGYQRYIYTHSGFIKWAERMGKID